MALGRLNDGKRLVGKVRVGLILAPVKLTWGGGSWPGAS